MIMLVWQKLICNPSQTGIMKSKISFLFAKMMFPTSKVKQYRHSWLYNIQIKVLYRDKMASLFFEMLLLFTAKRRLTLLYLMCSFVFVFVKCVCLQWFHVHFTKDNDFHYATFARETKITINCLRRTKKHMKNVVTL